LRLTIPFELPPVSLGDGRAGNTDAASGNISIISVIIEASRNLKSTFQEIEKF
jgi:hypothetical protein